MGGWGFLVAQKKNALQKLKSLKPKSGKFGCDGFSEFQDG